MAKVKAKSKSNRKTKQFSLDEQFRQLRSNIEFSQMDSDLSVINVVSTFPDEGKTTVAVNLARMYSARYKRVLLIDCDLRNPNCHKHLKVTNSSGVTNLLAEYRRGTSLLAMPQMKTLAFADLGTNMYFLSAGKKVPNPAELLSSQRFQAFLAQAKEEFDVVILDCSPLAPVSDGVSISNISDGTLYCVSATETNKYAARNCMRNLERNGVNVLGVVLTKVTDFGSGSYGYGYGYGHGYGYGYGYESDHD